MLYQAVLQLSKIIYFNQREPENRFWGGFGICGGPSFYDVHTEGEGGQAQVDECGRGEGVQPHVDVHTEN